MDLRAKITDAVYENPRADDQINAVMEVVENRVQELEAENEKLRRQLDTAHGKRPGTWDTWDEYIARKQAEPADPPPKPRLTLEEARKQAAEHAAATRTP